MSDIRNLFLLKQVTKISSDLKIIKFTTVLALAMTTREIIEKMKPISLKEMDDVKLMNRIDTKYMMSADMLPFVLGNISENYRVLKIKDERIFDYTSLYYDTDNDFMYMAHHNGRLNRFKIRSRKYVSSNLCFLEIKYKIKGDRTIKYRVVIDDIETNLSANSKSYIATYTPFKDGMLRPKIYTDFSRITMVNNELSERVTIDLGLNFHQNGNLQEVGNVVVIEFKREGTNKSSKLVDALEYSGVFPQSFSKYCIGRALIEKNLKSNNFKSRILTINKINDGKYYYRNASGC
jgi:hypothetical protein